MARRVVPIQLDATEFLGFTVDGDGVVLLENRYEVVECCLGSVVYKEVIYN